MNSLNKYSPYFLALLRIIAGYMFLLHGTAKLFEFPLSMTGRRQRWRTAVFAVRHRRSY